MTGLPSPQSVAFGCVAEPTPRFYAQALRLVQSIRWFGGALANADVFVCVAGEVDAAWRREFEALGALVRVVQLFNPLNRFSNKIRFLELPELARYTTAVLLDCDVALVQDPSAYLIQPALQLKIADLPTVSSARLAWLCARFELVAPAPIYRTTCSEDSTIWYCNTGVLIIPTAWIGRILPSWRTFILQLCAEPALLDPHYNHCNQAAMALAYIADPLPFAELPVAMNFPLHLTDRRPTEALLREDPVILHYHDRVDADGLLLAAPYPLAQARIQQLNQRLRASVPGGAMQANAAAERATDIRAAQPAEARGCAGNMNYLLIAGILLVFSALAVWLLEREVTLMILVVVGVLCVICTQILLYRRTQQRTSLVHHEVHELHQQMHQMHQETYAQFQETRQMQQAIMTSLRDNQGQTEALFSLFSLIRFTNALPSTRDAAARPDLLKYIVSTVYSSQPHYILELGSGVSTLVAAYSLRNLGRGTIASLDHDGDYTQASREQISAHGLAETAQVIHAPLCAVHIQGKQWLWYDMQAFQPSAPIDLLIIDGPIGSTQPLARYPALPLLWKYLHAGSIIILDDGKRPDEQKIVELWLNEFAGLSAEYIATEKGAYLLSCKDALFAK